MKLTEEKKNYVEELKSKFGSVVTRKQIVSHTKGDDEKLDASKLPRWLLNNKSFRAGRGVYNLDLVVDTSEVKEEEKTTEEVSQ